jgi:single-strand DNA-binding protein
VTTFRVAVGRQWRDSNGEPHDETEWFSVVAWNKLAEICSQ